jgi:hypothetical protein
MIVFKINLGLFNLSANSFAGKIVWCLLLDTVAAVDSVIHVDGVSVDEVSVGGVFVATTLSCRALYSREAMVRYNYVFDTATKSAVLGFSTFSHYSRFLGVIGRYILLLLT